MSDLFVAFSNVAEQWSGARGGHNVLKTELVSLLHNLDATKRYWGLHAMLKWWLYSAEQILLNRHLL